MTQCAKTWFVVVSAVAVLAASVFPAHANVEVTDVSWQMSGTTVQFRARFHNPDPVNPSGPVSGTMSTQPFGAFVPNNGLIGSFDVPMLQPDSFFDVMYDVELSNLPPSAEKILPVGGGGALASAPTDCPPDLFWAGNVDVFWQGPGGTGNVMVHNGTLQASPGGPPSYIHVVMDCQDPGGISWALGPLCPGWSVTLNSDNGSFYPDGPAPNPIPPGLFDGWLCVSADATVAAGGTCCFFVNLTCGTQPATINMCAEACFTAPVSTEESTWGRIKSLYGE